MIVEVKTCGKCSSPELRRNGSSNGRPKYRCRACGHQAALQPAGAARAARYAQAEALLTERVAQRAIVRLTGVARMTLAKLAKKKRP